jgi:cardiolipin synthase
MSTASSYTPVLIDRALLRATGAPRSDGNAVRLLRDACENYPAWLAAIDGARRTIFFESYIVADDAVGRRFVGALAARARAGVAVRVVHDWLGCLGSHDIWDELEKAGAEVRAFNPFSFGSPFGWVSRDHRKTIAIDGAVAFVSGLCVSSRWEGDAAKRLEPWRDTGVEIRGPAVAEIERAFAQVWDVCGTPLAEELLTPPDAIDAAGDTALRVVVGVPSAGNLFRLDTSIASLARQYLWLTDAYFVGGSTYTQALRAAARDGVDVRLLVPGASDIPALRPLSRVGYRPLLEAGVRVFEWNGTMLHAKTAVADGEWARVGSTNLNLASFIGNWELDVAIEDAGFAATMADMYEDDLRHATEIVLTKRNRVRTADGGPASDGSRRALSGSAGRAAAGALSVGSAVGAALTNRRLLGPAEAGLLWLLAAITAGGAVLGLVFPALVAYPLALLLGWIAVTIVVKAWGLSRRARDLRRSADGEDAAHAGPPADAKTDRSAIIKS